jgi:DNA-binding transcriptional LysR family regulator
MDNLADFGITQLPVQDKKVQVVNVHTDEIKLIVPASHRFAAKEEILAREIVGEPLILPKTGTTRSRLNVWMEMVEDEITVSMELDSSEMIKRFVIAGLGASFMAESHCREDIREGCLAAVTLGPEPMVRRLGLIYRKDKALSKAALGFIDVILAEKRAVGVDKDKERESEEGKESRASART